MSRLLVPATSVPGSRVPGGTAPGTGAEDSAGLIAALRDALDGVGPALEFGAHAEGGEVPEEVAVVVPTSGSTGRPRRVLLTGDALRASAAATEERLGGPGRWLLALPLDHVAGVQVLVRSALAGTSPVRLPGGGFDPDALAAACGRLPAHNPSGRTYASLVPTQLHRLVEDARAGGGAGLRALARLDAVLVGGSGVSAGLLSEARAAGVRAVTTYGMTETCGGCVYDGVPLPGVRVRLEEDGRILLGGPVLAAGYLDTPRDDAPEDGDAGESPAGSGFVAGDASGRWFRSADRGVWDGAGGRLTVLGRLDDVVITGGVKVLPSAVEELLGGWAGIGECCVVGVEDAEWGHSVVAVVVPEGPGHRPADGLPSIEAVRERVAGRLGRAAAPRHLLSVPGLPLRGPGKVDRAAVRDLARSRLAAPPPTTTGSAAVSPAATRPTDA